MSLLKANEIRKMNPNERARKLKEIRNELMHERGLAAMGGAPVSPGRFRSLRTEIARILTVMAEEGDANA